MWPYHPDLLTTPVPRYTSYPTAAEFHDRIGPGDMADALDALPDGSAVSLYLHIPFCREICWYCGCNTGAANRVARVETYVDCLMDEVALVADRLDGRARVARIAFGGGSPNALSPVTFARLVTTVISAFATPAAELSVEIDPRGFDADWAAVLAAARVSRVSLGVQTFAPRVQAAIGRVQPFDTVARNVAMLRGAGVTSLNFDLMYGLPQQTLADVDETLTAALALQPDRLAVFGYAHVPAAIPRQRRIDAEQLADTEARFVMAAHAHDRLVAAGFVAIGFDHFARPCDPLAQAAATGRLRRNFQGFTDDTSTVLLGFGASAISAFPDRLLQNEKNNGRYQMAISSGRLAANRGLYRSVSDRAHGAAIAAVLSTGRADVAALADRSRIVEVLRPFEKAGLVRWHGSQLCLAPEALPYARTIAAAFDTYRNGSAQAFSRAV